MAKLIPCHKYQLFSDLSLGFLSCTSSLLGWAMCSQRKQEKFNVECTIEATISGALYGWNYGRKILKSKRSNFLTLFTGVTTIHIMCYFILGSYVTAPLLLPPANQPHISHLIVSGPFVFVSGFLWILFDWRAANTSTHRQQYHKILHGKPVKWRANCMDPEGRECISQSVSSLG
jgi:hypothetical protein